MIANHGDRFLPRALTVAVLALLSLLSPPGIAAQEPAAAPRGNVDLSLSPLVHIPTPTDVGLGSANEAGARLRFGKLPVYADAAVSYAWAGSTGTNVDGSVATIGVDAGAGLLQPVAPRFDLFLGGRIGYGSSTLRTDDRTTSDNSLRWLARGGGQYRINDRFALALVGGVTAQMATYLSYEAGLALSFTPPARTRGPKTEPLPERPGSIDDAGDDDESGLLLTDPVDAGDGVLRVLNAGFVQVFPVLYQHYRDVPVGSITLENTSRSEIGEITIAVNIPRFTDLSQPFIVAETLAPGERKRIDLKVLLNEEVLRVTEGTRVAAEIGVSYVSRGSERSVQAVTTLSVAGRNAMTWDDDRKAAAYVTARDPSILAFARGVVASVRDGGGTLASANLRTATVLYEAIALHGVRYVIDPTTPYAEFSTDQRSIDFLQFPVQTLQYGAGDCDDLSIAYTAALEAVGVPAAFVTIPGHIFAAFDTGLRYPDDQDVLPPEDQLIILGERVWMPVEVTILQQGFYEAWRTGARQWRQYDPRGEAALIPVEEAWEVYRPTGLDLEQRPEFDLPSRDQLRTAYEAQLERYKQSAIEPHLASINRQIESRGPSPRVYNRLGVLYAKYELYEEAKRWFEEAVGLEPTVDSIMNLGHLAYIDRDYRQALRYYEQASGLAPERDDILLALARAYYDVEDYDIASGYYGTLQSRNPDLAAEYAYLESGDRATMRSAESAGMAPILWAE